MWICCIDLSRLQTVVFGGFGVTLLVLSIGNYKNYKRVHLSFEAFCTLLLQGAPWCWCVR